MSSELLDQGRSSSQSTYVLLTVYSLAPGDMRARRSYSRLAAASTFSGRSALSMRSRRSSSSTEPSSVSPSSRWMAFICCRR